MKVQTNQAGFTLIEMMVALLLLTMISIIGYQGIIFAVKQWNGGERKLEKAFNESQAISMLRKKISAMARVSHYRDGKYIYAFSGRHQTLQFVSRFENSKQGGLYICKLDRNSDRKNVELVYGLLHPENGSFDKPKHLKRTEVIGDIKQIQFWYFGSQHGERGQWYEQWNVTTALPKLIKLKLTRQGGKNTESVFYVETSGA